MMALPTELYKNIEKNTQTIFSKHLPLMIALHGTSCRHYIKTPTIEDDAYGIHSGSKKASDGGDQKILMSTTQWRLISSYEGGYLDEIGYMYCNFDLKDGDHLVLKRDDTLSITLMAVGTESLGINTAVLKRFKISNVGEQS